MHAANQLIIIVLIVVSRALGTIVLLLKRCSNGNPMPRCIKIWIIAGRVNHVMVTCLLHLVFQSDLTSLKAFLHPSTVSSHLIMCAM